MRTNSHYEIKVRFFFERFVERMCPVVLALQNMGAEGGIKTEGGSNSRRNSGTAAVPGVSAAVKPHRRGKYKGLLLK